MTTEVQIMANRTNALKSTGPKSNDGKEVASQNALKHGLLSKDLLIHDEKRKDLENFRNQIYSTLAPQGTIEELLIEKIVNAAWRLQRLMRIEVSIFDKDELEKKDEFSGIVLVQQGKARVIKAVLPTGLDQLDKTGFNENTSFSIASGLYRLKDHKMHLRLSSETKYPLN